MRALFKRWVLSRVWLTFIVLGLSFLAFGAGTVNLGRLFIENFRFLSEYGWQAVMDGGLLQLTQLVLTSYASMAAYVVFKACEQNLVRWLRERPLSDTSSSSSEKRTNENRSPPR